MCRVQADRCREDEIEVGDSVVEDVLEYALILTILHAYYVLSDGN